MNGGGYLGCCTTTFSGHAIQLFFYQVKDSLENRKKNRLNIRPVMSDFFSKRTLRAPDNLVAN